MRARCYPASRSSTAPRPRHAAMPSRNGHALRTHAPHHRARPNRRPRSSPIPRPARRTHPPAARIPAPTVRRGRQRCERNRPPLAAYHVRSRGTPGPPIHSTRTHDPAPLGACPFDRPAIRTPFENRSALAARRTSGHRTPRPLGCSSTLGSLPRRDPGHRKKTQPHVGSHRTVHATRPADPRATHRPPPVRNREVAEITRHPARGATDDRLPIPRHSQVAASPPPNLGLKPCSPIPDRRDAPS